MSNCLETNLGFNHRGLWGGVGGVDVMECGCGIGMVSGVRCIVGVGGNGMIRKTND